MFRQVIDSLLPPGNLWVPEPYGDLDRLLDGIAACSQNTVDFLSKLAKVRDPLLTPFLSDLEQDFGILPDSNIDEAIRRIRLFVVKTANSSDGTGEWLQDALRRAGFNVYVHVNDPPVDPASLLQFDTGVIFGEPGNEFGESPDQFVAVGDGELLVNGPLYVDQTLIHFPTPTDPSYFPLIFFIGGPATRNVDGELTSMEWAQVPVNRKNEFIRLIIKYKPMIVWAGLKIEYV